MNPSELVRDASRVHAALRELPDGRLITLKTLRIYVPARFAERQLAHIGIETQIVGIYAMVVEDKYYGVSMVNAMHRIEPTSTIKVTWNEDEYFQFTFEPGATVFPSVQLVRTDTLVYRIYDELISKGRVPWYLGYTELGKIFDTARHHAGANIGGNHEVTELIVSMIARDPSDRTKYYRSTIESLDELKSRPPVIIPLRSVTYGATNTTNKLAGSYFQEGLVSALNSPATRVEKIEALLRS
jgi:hypothetical protein